MFYIYIYTVYCLFFLSVATHLAVFALWHTNVPYVGVEAHVIGCFLKLQGRVGDSKFMVTIRVPG